MANWPIEIRVPIEIKGRDVIQFEIESECGRMKCTFYPSTSVWGWACTPELAVGMRDIFRDAMAGASDELRALSLDDDPCPSFLAKKAKLACLRTASNRIRKRLGLRRGATGDSVFEFLFRIAKARAMCRKQESPEPEIETCVSPRMGLTLSGLGKALGRQGISWEVALECTNDLTERVIAQDVQSPFTAISRRRYQEFSLKSLRPSCS
jgi:hypothetical protein